MTFPVIWQPEPEPVSRVILHHPDNRLRLKSKPVVIDQTTHKLIAEMEKLMREADGAGLAAVQVGELLRLFLIAAHVANPQVPATDPPIVFINPKIVGRSLSTVVQVESCLSLPDTRVPVRRYRQVRTRATDLNGKPFEVKASGFYARAIQHEIEHLAGLLITDHQLTPS